MDPKGKVAIVTGGGTGLGKTISLKLAAAGASLAINYSRSEKEANETVAEIKQAGGNAVAVKADVSSSSDVKRMVDEVVRAFGGVDILVNNAGATVFVRMEDLEGMKEEDWDRIMAVNVRGPFLCAKTVAPIMKQRGSGKVINITSLSGLRVGGSSMAYCVSKAAEEMLTKCLAIAMAPEVQVNSVAPGLIITRWGLQWGEEMIKRITEGSLLKRVATLDEVAEAAMYFVRNDAVTAQTAVVDAGSAGGRR